MSKKKITLMIVLLLILSIISIHNLTSPYEELEKTVSSPFTLRKTIEEETYSLMIFTHDGWDDLSWAIARNRGFSTKIEDYSIQGSISDWLQQKGFSITHILPSHQTHVSYVFGTYDPKVTSIKISIDQMTADVEMDRTQKIWWYKLDEPIKKLTLQSFEQGKLLHETIYMLQ